MSVPSLPTPPGERLEQRFSDKKPAFSTTQAVVEANRCIYCFDAPCIRACPTGIDIPEFIRKIASGNLSGSARTILDANILGFSCARVCPVEVLCEGDCVYNEMGQPPIEIGRLQRYATDDAYRRGTQFFAKGPATGKRIALVGAGPASLACAHELTRLGHEAVLLEAGAYPGGLNSSGVAPYKLMVEEALREVAYVQGIGFEIQYGVRVGRDLPIAQLEADYDAIFLGMGLGMDGWLRLEGEGLSGVYGALDVIAQIKLQSDYALPPIDNAVVIGAGNTAMDIVRELLGLKVESVTLLYRRDEAAMSGYGHEWSEAKAAGAKAVWWGQPMGFTGDRVVTGVRYLSNRNPTAFSGERVLEADFVALAIGQEKFVPLLERIGRIELERGRVKVDPESGQTTHPKYFAGGDCANGGKEVVNAAAEGKVAAHGIDRYLTGTT